jgi:hypothetical protein
MDTGRVETFERIFPGKGNGPRGRDVKRPVYLWEGGVSEAFKIIEKKFDLFIALLIVADNTAVVRARMMGEACRQKTTSWLSR